MIGATYQVSTMALLTPEYVSEQADVMEAKAEKAQRFHLTLLGVAGLAAAAGAAWLLFKR
jgi:hypothetical protein